MPSLTIQVHVTLTCAPLLFQSLEVSRPSHRPAGPPDTASWPTPALVSSSPSLLRQSSPGSVAADPLEQSAAQHCHGRVQVQYVGVSYGVVGRSRLELQRWDCFAAHVDDGLVPLVVVLFAVVYACSSQTSIVALYLITRGQIYLGCATCCICSNAET